MQVSSILFVFLMLTLFVLSHCVASTSLPKEALPHTKKKKGLLHFLVGLPLPHITPLKIHLNSRSELIIFSSWSPGCRDSPKEG